MPLKSHPTPLTLEKCTAYFEEATAKAFKRAIDAGQEVVGVRDGQLVIFEKGKAPRLVRKIKTEQSPSFKA